MVGVVVRNSQLRSVRVSLSELSGELSGLACVVFKGQR